MKARTFLLVKLFVFFSRNRPPPIAVDLKANALNLSKGTRCDELFEMACRRQRLKGNI